MKKSSLVYLLVVILVLTTLLRSCKKDESPAIFDLFPLHVGNEYYYEYSDFFMHDISGPIIRSKGKNKWTILSDTIKNNMIEFYVEEKFNGTDVYDNSILSKSIDTTFVNDRIRYFKVIEDPSGLLTFREITKNWNITFKRYQNVPDTIIDDWIGSNREVYYCFHADKGMTKYRYWKGPISDQSSETYDLDSVKIFH
jgi:hypothetical protein